MDKTNQAQNQSSLNRWHTFISAAAGGAGGAYINFPFEGLKKRLQTGQKISLHPRELYRGSTAFAVSVTFATIASMSFNNALKEVSSYNHNSSLSNGVSAVTSGMLGALVGSTPVENVILTQQLHKTSPIKAIAKMVKEGGPRRLWVGLPELAFREGGFACAMLYGVEAARNEALSKTDNKLVAEAAALSVGVVGAAITHPFDTVATIKQKSDGQLSSTSAIKQIYEINGPKGFFRGVGNRVVLFTGCAYTIPAISTLVQNWLSKR